MNKIIIIAVVLLALYVLYKKRKTAQGRVTYAPVSNQSNVIHQTQQTFADLGVPMGYQQPQQGGFQYTPYHP